MHSETIVALLHDKVLCNLHLCHCLLQDAHRCRRLALTRTVQHTCPDYSTFLCLSGSARTSSIPPSTQRSLLSKIQPPALSNPNTRQILQQTEAVGTAVGPQLNTQAAAALQPNVAPAGPVEPASTDAASPTSVQTTQASTPGSIAAPVRQADAKSSSANTAADSATPSSSSVLHASPNSAALQPPQAAELVSRPSTRSSSRCSTRSGKGTKTGCSPFDTRLALLHKGLPTHLPYAAIARPFSRSRRPSSSLQHASAASGDSNAILSSKEGAVDPAPDVLSLERAADSSEVSMGHI